MAIRRLMMMALTNYIRSLINVFKTRVLSSQGEFEGETCLNDTLEDMGVDLFDQASLVITPNGYKENVLFSVTPSPVGTNLFTRSSEFENSIWIKNLLTISTTFSTAPNTLLEARTVQTAVDASAGRHRLIQQISSFVAGGTSYTFSVYAKKNQHRWIQLNFTTNFSVNDWANFNLENGLIGNTGTGAIATIENVGSGWYRLSISGIAIATGAATNAEILTTNNTDSGRYPSYQSTVAENVFDIWGAQLETGTTVGTYIPTVTRRAINETICDFTVTRATTGTRVNSEGLIENVPYNLFSQSETFENAYWVKQNTTVSANSITAPNGTMTADKVICNNGVAYAYTGSLGVNIVSNSFPSNTSERVVSFYLKYGGLNRIRVIYGGATTLSGGIYVEVDLQLGIITGSNGGSVASNFFIENAGNDWYRVGFTNIMTLSPTNNRFAVGLGDTTKTVGDGVDGVFVWGAQLVEGTQTKDYFPVTNRFNIPRHDYSNGCPTLLVEPQRTNLLAQSADFTNGWSQEGSSITGNTQISPDGLLTADSIFELATNDVHRTYRPSIAVTANAIYTASFFVKKNNVRYVRLILTQNGSTTIWAGAQFDLDTQTFTSQVGTGGGVFSTASITSFINGWYRISVSGSIPGTGMIPMLALSNGSAMLNTDTRGCPVYLGNTSNSLFIWGAQLEAQLGMTSYIPTTTGSITRNADVISNTNGFDLIGQTEGTIFVDYNKVLANDGSRNIISLSDATAQNAIEIWDGVGSGNLGRIIYTYFANNIIRSAGIGQSSISPSGRYKICVTYLITPALVNFKIFINGVKLDDRNFTYTAFSNPLTRINIGNRNGTGVGVGSHNLDFILKTRITDAQAIQLTTL